MSINYTLCLLIRRAALADGLDNLGSFTLSTTPKSTFDPWPTSRPSLSATDFLNRLRMPEQSVFRAEEIFRLEIKHSEDDIGVVLWLTGEMQELFQLTSSHEFLLLSLGFSLRSDQDFIPFEHPLMPLILAITSRLVPTYGWIEADFTGTERDFKIWYEHSSLDLNSFPTPTPPWLLPSSTWIIGEPLSSRIKPFLRHALSSEAGAYVEKLKDGLLIITQPGNPESAERFSRSDGTAYDDHKAVAETSVRSALRNIPIGILN